MSHAGELLTSAWIDAATAARLGDLLESGHFRARSTGEPVLVSVTKRTPETVDPSAVVCASRVGDEPWFCFEQPDRDRIALAALGSVRTLEATGPGRFAAAPSLALSAPTPLVRATRSHTFFGAGRDR